MSLLNSLLDCDELSKFESELKTNNNIDVTPVDLETFLYSKEYLGSNIKLSDRQLSILKAADNCDDNTNKHTEFVIQIGKGGGKDTCIIFIFARIIYKLLCMSNPLARYGLSQFDTIDLLNVAMSADQARDVFFKRLSNVVKNAGPMAYRQFGFDPEKHIRKTQIDFPKSIITYSGHSKEQSQEGKNYFLVVMDEVGGFALDKAQAIYDVMRSSINTRFPKVGKLFLISYPRYKNDFIQRKYNEAERFPNIYRTKGSTWDFNPLRKRNDFDVDYLKNPEKARAMYECEPDLSGEAYIKDSEKIKLIFSNKIEVPFDNLGRLKEGFKANPYHPRSYYVHVDLGLGRTDEEGFRASDVAAVAMGYKEDDIIYLVLQKIYVGAPGTEIQFQKIREDIVSLKRFRGFDIRMCTFDGFQCWTSDTKVRLLNGQVKTMKELSEYKDPFWVYSYDQEKGIVPGLAKPAKLNRSKTKIIKLTLDNGEELKCTPDHPIMTREGNYKQAKDLLVGESLMPLYTKQDDKYQRGYELVYNPKLNRYSYTYQHIAKVFNNRNSIGKNCCVHHKDFNKRNNDPTNLEILSHSDHSKIHKRTKEFRDAQSKRISELNKTMKFHLGKKHSKKTKNYLKDLSLKLWKDKEYIAKMADRDNGSGMTGRHHSEETKRKIRD